MARVKRYVCLMYWISIFAAILALSECQETCKDQSWCSKFTSYCHGSNREDEMKRLCPIACGHCRNTVQLSSWSRWTECSSRCGYGKQRRSRHCNSTDCQPDSLGVVEERRCYMQCGSWGEWGSWSDCSLTCGEGKQTRTRRCKGETCVGGNQTVRACHIQGCPAWTEWSGWSPCSRTCGEGRKRKSRTCMNGVPEVDCEGLQSEEITCGELQRCPGALVTSMAGCEDSQAWCEDYGKEWCSSWHFSIQCRRVCGQC